METGDADPREEIFYALSEAKLPLFAMRSLEVTLEEIFLQLTENNSNQEA